MKCPKILLCAVRFVEEADLTGPKKTQLNALASGSNDADIRKVELSELIAALSIS